MRVFPQMQCCKSERQRIGLACDAGWMVGCLANHGARLLSPAARREFAAQVARVELIAQAGLQRAFRDELARLSANPRQER